MRINVPLWGLSAFIYSILLWLLLLINSISLCKSEYYHYQKPMKINLSIFLILQTCLTWYFCNLLWRDAWTMCMWRSSIDIFACINQTQVLTHNEYFISIWCHKLYNPVDKQYNNIIESPRHLCWWHQRNPCIFTGVRYCWMVSVMPCTAHNPIHFGLPASSITWPTNPICLHLPETHKFVA